MKRLLLLLLFVSFIFAATGGPDSLGHEWFDSDEAGVTYDWIDTVGATNITADYAGDHDDGAVEIEIAQLAATQIPRTVGGIVELEPLAAAVR